MADDTRQQPQNFNELVIRQLERLEERTRDIVTRADLENLRKELVTQAMLNVQLDAINKTVARVDADRVADKLASEKRDEDIEKDILSKQDRLWIRLGQAAGFIGLALVLLQYLMHVHLTP